MKSYRPQSLLSWLLSSLLALLFLNGCAGVLTETRQQQAATAIYASGYAVSNDALTHGVGILSQLQDVATKLPKLNSGTLTPNDLGVFAGELKNVAAQTTLLKGIVPADSAVLDNASAFIAGVISQVGAINSGRAPTINEVVENTALIGFANGLTDGIGFWQGKQSVPKPTSP